MTPLTAWATLEQARQDWPDAPTSDDVLARLLADATPACQAYAPALADPDTIPAHYSRACTLQARELWAAARRDGDVIGGAEYAVRARDLTATVRSLLRPRRGLPRVR